jgi:hypothetical protein
VLSRRVDIGVLGVFGDISEVDAGLLRLRGAAMQTCSKPHGAPRPRRRPRGKAPDSNDGEGALRPRLLPKDRSGHCLAQLREPAETAATR